MIYRKKNAIYNIYIYIIYIIVVVRSVFYDGDRYFPTNQLNSYRCCSMTGLMCLKAKVLIKLVIGVSVILVITGTFFRII